MEIAQVRAFESRFLLEVGEERGEFTAKVSLPFESPDGANAHA